MYAVHEESPVLYSLGNVSCLNKFLGTLFKTYTKSLSSLLFSTDLVFQAAALNQCQSYPVMSYPAEVGVSSYVVVNFPVGKKRTLVTRTAARTFCADFSWHAELQLPLFSANNATDAQRPRENHVSLAEQLETREVSFEIW